MRSLTTEEKQALLLIARALDDEESRTLIADIQRARVGSERASLLRFCLDGYTRPEYLGQKSYGIEGKVEDSDGFVLDVDLFRDHNGHLLELEFIRYGENGEAKPKWRTFRVTMVS